MTGLVMCSTLRKGLVKLTLNRPERRNALSIELLADLTNALDRLAEDGTTRVVILCANGSAFSSGMDLAQASDPKLIDQGARAIARTLQLLRSSALITIAAVHGGAYAGGAGLMAACDMAIGSMELQIGFPEARRGLLPALICSILSTKVREGDLRELFLVGNSIDALRAMQIGLLQRVVPFEQLLSTAEEMADGILKGGPKTIIATKRLISQAYVAPEAVSIAHMIELHSQARSSDEANEGLKAFLEKRLPSWSVC